MIGLSLGVMLGSDQRHLLRAFLDFDFIANQTLPVGTTFTRTTIGTRFNSAGLLVTESPNVPRFDYDPVALSALGLLVEPQRTNLMAWSESLDNSFWTKTASSIAANVETAPDGVATADKLQTDTTTAAHSVVSANVGSVAGSPYTISVFAKPSELSIAFLNFNSPGFGTPSTSTFNLSSAVIVAGSGVTASMRHFANAWVQCVATKTATATASGAFRFGVTLSDGDPVSTGANTTDGMFLCGMQVEQGAFPTSYIPTTTGQVTRTADVATVTLPQPADILVQDREGGQWIAGVPAGPYTLAPRTDKRHIARWRAYPAGYAASHPELAVAYP